MHGSGLEKKAEMKKTGIAVIISFFTILLSACADSNLAGQPSLENTSWVLTAFNDKHPIEGTQPTIHFEDAQVSGKASCNSYGGSYQVTGDAISFSVLFQNEMFCIDPEGVMEQERTYMDLLGVAQRFEVFDGVLTIFVGTQKTLTFERQ
jgi:heat shock protein HslJ